jgi:hypothetical protein
VTRVSDSVSRWEAQALITAFARAISAAAAERETALLLSRAERAACSRLTGDLLPRRVGAAQLSLVALDHDDTADLREFVVVAAEVAVSRIRTAADADELADAVGDALDSLHSFLLTHQLVADGYLDDVASHNLVESAADDAEDWDDAIQTRERAGVASSSENNLALAA